MVRPSTSYWDNQHWLLKQHFFVAFVADVPNEINIDGLGPIEKELHAGHKWWSLTHLQTSNETFIPKQTYHLLKPIVEQKIYPNMQIVDLSMTNE